MNTSFGFISLKLKHFIVRDLLWSSVKSSYLQKNAKINSPVIIIILLIKSKVLGKKTTMKAIIQIGKCGFRTTISDELPFFSASTKTHSDNGQPINQRNQVIKLACLARVYFSGPWQNLSTLWQYLKIWFLQIANKTSLT